MPELPGECSLCADSSPLEGHLERGAQTSVDEDDPLRSTSSEELDSARRVDVGACGERDGGLGSEDGLSVVGSIAEGEKSECEEDIGALDSRKQSVCSGGRWEFPEGGVEENRCAHVVEIRENEALGEGNAGALRGNRIEGTSGGRDWSANGVTSLGSIEKWETPEGMREWGVYLRLKHLAEKVDRPFRICVKGLAGNVRQIIRMTAFVAGFDTVNETKEKNMWLGQRSEDDGAAPVRRPDSVSVGKPGREVSSQPSLEEISYLHGISDDQIADMDVQIQQAIVAYLATWMADVSETFKRSETCCTSLELNCFLMSPEWVLKQAAELAERCCLVAVPVSNGHLKIQKLSRSVGCGNSNQASGQDILELRSKLSSQKSQSVENDTNILKSLVIERLQECYMSRQREHIFILEVPGIDVRQILITLAKAIGFVGPKITSKGKFVVCKGNSGISTDSNKNLHCISDVDIRRVEESIQRGVRSFLLSWFAHFERTGIAQKLLTTTSFLVPESWVEEAVRSIGESINVEVKSRGAGTLEITRKEATKHDMNTRQVWAIEKSTGVFATDAYGLQIENNSKEIESTSTTFLAPETCHQRFEKVTRKSDEALQTSQSDQVGVWNQLKYLYKQKRQGAHLVWAEGLPKQVKETICHAGLKLGFTSTQDLGPYIRLSRFDCTVPGEPSTSRGYGCNGCKLGKLSDSLRKKVIGLDSEVVPTIEAHIDSLLQELMRGNDLRIRVELEKYPLPEFWVARIVGQCMERANNLSRKAYGSSTNLVMKHNVNGIAHLEKMTESSTGTFQVQASGDVPLSNSMVQQPLNSVSNCMSRHCGFGRAMEQGPSSALFGSLSGRSGSGSFVYQPGMAGKSLSAPGQRSKQTSSSITHRRDIRGLSSSTYCLPTNTTDVGRPANSFVPVDNKDQEHRALLLKSPQDHDFIVATTNNGSSGMEEDNSQGFCAPASSSMAILRNFRSSFSPTRLLASPRVSCILSPEIGELPAVCPDTRKLHEHGHVDPFRQNLELERLSASMSTLPLKARVHYVKTLEDMAFWCNFIVASKVKVMGIDTEWKPNLSPGDNHPVALIQICFRDLAFRKSAAPTYLCILFHVHHSSFTASFVALLENYSIMKVGVQIDMDVHKVKRDHQIEMNNCVELYTEAGGKGIYARGLKGLVAAVLHHDLPKNKSVTLSNWEESPLTQQQEQYAAYDAYAALRVFEELHGIGESLRV